MANFKGPLQMVQAWTGFPLNGQSGHLYKLGDWKTAESWPILNFFWSESFKFLLASELQSDRVTDTQGYPLYGWVKFFCA